MKILVTNDDGVYAEGLWTLVRAIMDNADVLVVAPDREQSGVGTSVTLHQPLRMREVEPPVKGIETYCVEGTPADSVILGLRVLAKEGIDLVMSGINYGLNLGNDVFISGTVGGALQAHFNNIPAVALSCEFENGDVHFDPAARLAKSLTKHVSQNGLRSGTLLNINFPLLTFGEIQGIELTRIGGRSYRDEVRKGNDGRREYYWIVQERREWDNEEGTDIGAIQQRKISVTPFQTNLTDSGQIDALNTLCSSVFSE
ncbi:MAG: 5'/3'-nucleotidase SurE [Dehalococcoidia bacterium]